MSSQLMTDVSPEVSSKILGAVRDFNRPHADVHEVSCYARGDSCCEYEVRWREFPHYTLFFGLLGAACGVAGAILVPSLWWWLLPVVFLLAGREVYQLHLERYTTRVLGDQRGALLDHEVAFLRCAEDLAEFNATLERLVQERAAQLSYARDGMRRRNRRLRRAMRELERLQDDFVDAGLNGALGQFMGDFAHEVNNPLCALNICLTVIEKRMPRRLDDSGHPLENPCAALSQIRDGIERIRSVLAWSADGRPNAPVPTPLDLDAEIHKTVKLINKVHNKDGAELHLVSCEDAWIHAVGRQPKQVIASLLIRALHAASSNNIWVFTERTRREVVMRIADDGVGMDPDTLYRIFERRDSQGSAADRLFVCHAIVARHGGHITVESAPHEGTTFTVHWPAVTRPASLPPGP